VRIGLLRHFPVEQQFPTGWRTASDLQEWRERYDSAATVAGAFDLGRVDWQACISSDLPRAIITAQTVFGESFERTPLLREPQFETFRTGELRLPFPIWRWALRLSWMTGHRSQRACRDEFLGRVADVADHLCGLQQDTLVVSHAGMMAYLSAKLRRRGFQGPKLRVAKHARAYVYERP
jgi:broad specificity phosphatase PhoE